jgi:O-antigen ligase
MVRNPHFKSITLLLLLTRAYFFLFIVYIYVRSLKRLEGLNNLIFLLGTSSSLLFTFIYIHVLNIGSPDRQGIIYEVGEFGIVRLEGFAGDPNFFGMLMLLPLACGFQWHVSRGKFVLKTIALFLIITNIALTVSRTILISSLLGLLIMCFLMVYRSLRYSKKLLGVMVKFSLVTACCLGAAFLFKGPFMEVKPFSYYSKRLFVPTPRFSYWTELLDMFVKKPLAGHGLRMVEQTLGGFGKYGHNTYLELLVETGLIGFIMFALFMLLVFLKGVKVMNSNSEIIPWLYVWIVIFVMFGGFTLLQYPYVWMVAGVILSRRLHKNQS